MTFNAHSYRRNRYRREALAGLETARDIKARAGRGDAYEWEIARIPTIVRLARLSWRLYLGARRIQPEGKRKK